MRILIFLILILIFVAGCHQITQSNVSFETISKGFNSGHIEKKHYVIENEAEWKNLWGKTNSISIPQPELPEVDFNKEMVIAVFQGEKSTGGYSIEIVNIVEDSKITVFYKEFSPEPGDFVTQALTQPYHIVKIKKTDKEIVFQVK